MWDIFVPSRHHPDSFTEKQVKAGNTMFRIRLPQLDALHMQRTAASIILGQHNNGI